MSLLVAATVSLTLFLIVMGIGLLLVPRPVAVQSRLRSRQLPPERRSAESAERQGMSSVKELQTVLEQIPLSHRLEMRLQGAGSSMNVSSFILLTGITAVTGGMIGWWVTDLARTGLLGCGLGAVVPIAWLSWQRYRRLRAFEKQFPDALDMMVNALKSGAALTAALGVIVDEAPAPVSTEFGILLQQQKFGVDMRECLRDLRRRIGLVDVHLFATAMSVQRETGGNLAEVLENIAAVIRDRFRIMGDARTLTAEGRMSGMVLGILPVALAVIMFFVAPEQMLFFTEHAAGKVMVVAAIVLEIIGFLVTRSICNIKV